MSPGPSMTSKTVAGVHQREQAQVRLTVTSALQSCECDLGFERLHRMPGQAFECRGARLVLAADPAAIADRIEMAEQERIVDLAGAGLVTAGIVGELDVG